MRIVTSSPVPGSRTRAPGTNSAGSNVTDDRSCTSRRCSSSGLASVPTTIRGAVHAGKLERSLAGSAQAVGLFDSRRRFSAPPICDPNGLTTAPAGQSRLFRGWSAQRSTLAASRRPGSTDAVGTGESWQSASSRQEPQASHVWSIPLTPVMGLWLPQKAPAERTRHLGDGDHRGRRLHSSTPPAVLTPAAKTPVSDGFTLGLPVVLDAMEVAAWACWRCSIPSMVVTARPEPRDR